MEDWPNNRKKKLNLRNAFKAACDFKDGIFPAWNTVYTTTSMFAQEYKAHLEHQMELKANLEKQQQQHQHQQQQQVQKRKDQGPTQHQGPPMKVRKPSQPKPDLLMQAVEAIDSDEIIIVNPQPGQADLIDENFIIIDHQPGGNQTSEGNQTTDELEENLNNAIEAFLIGYQSIPDTEKDAKLQVNFQMLMEEIEKAE